MQGTLARLVPVEKEDYALVAKWLQPSRVATMGAGGTATFTSVADIEVGMAKMPLVMIETMDGRKVGLVQWHTLGHDRSYELGAVVGEPELWDSGCGAEASLLALDFLFRAMDAHRVQFMAGLYNQRVLTFLFKTDIVIEGVLRDYFYFDGAFHDAVIASVLRSEYDQALAEGEGFVVARDMVPAEEKQLALKEFRAQMRPRWDRMFTDLVERN